jgi:peptidoglycan/LPS O-acetylase OafA/YrhL
VAGAAGPGTAGAALKRERVLGWDILRGLCALAVASYHLLEWLDVAQLHTFGSYGVYLFFVLSGASLAYNYQGLIDGPAAAARFLAVRWLRLAPLFLVVGVLFVLLLRIHLGYWTDRLGWRALLNVTFAFGLHDPTQWALPVGGWSLGIEFVLYLAFPLLLPLLRRPSYWIVTGAALAALQWAWIERTAGSAAGYEASAVAYHQVPAFAAYFFGGCVIGAARRSRDRTWSFAWGILVWIAAAVLLLALDGKRQGDELLGWRGATLFVACFAVVFASGQATVGPAAARAARWLGDITYGCYLLHPMIFFGFAWLAWPHWTTREITDAALPLRLALLVAVLAASCIAAQAGERWFEAPVRRWGQRRLPALRRAGPPAHIEAASISS